MTAIRCEMCGEGADMPAFDLAEHMRILHPDAEVFASMTYQPYCSRTDVECEEPTDAMVWTGWSWQSLCLRHALRALNIAEADRG